MLEQSMASWEDGASDAGSRLSRQFNHTKLLFLRNHSVGFLNM